MGNIKSGKLNNLFSNFIRTQNKANDLWSKIRNEIIKLPIDEKLWVDLETTCLMHTEPASYIERVKELISKVEE